MLAAPSLGKRPIKMPNFKTIKAFLTAMHEQVKGFLSKCTVLKADLLQDIKYTVCYRTSNILFVTGPSNILFVTGPSNILFGGVYMCTFQPGNFTGWGSDGVKKVLTPKIRTMCSIILNQRSV